KAASYAYFAGHVDSAAQFTNVFLALIYADAHTSQTFGALEWLEKLSLHELVAHTRAGVLDENHDPAGALLERYDDLTVPGRCVLCVMEKMHKHGKELFTIRLGEQASFRTIEFGSGLTPGDLFDCLSDQGCHIDAHNGIPTDRIA